MVHWKKNCQMNRFEDRCQFTQYLLKQLGSPLLDIVVEYDSATGSGYGGDCETTGTTGTTGTSGTDAIACAVKSQMDYVIDDAVDYFREYGSDVGNVQGVIFIELEDGKNIYTLPENSEIITVQQPMRGGLGNSMGFNFDQEEAQASVGLFSFASTFGHRGIYSFMGGGTYDNLLTFEVAAEYVSLVEMRYSRKFQIEHNRLQQEIKIYPTPTARDNRRIIAAEVWRRVPEEYVFTHPWVRRYATALLKLQVGRNTSMYDGIQFPGGGSFNASFYYNEGKEDRDKLEEELMTGKWGNPPGGAVFLWG